MTFDIARPSFTLPENFVDRYVDKQPQWGPLGYFSFKRTYARQFCKKCLSYRIDYDKAEKRRFCEDCRSSAISVEEWWQTCRRVVEGVFSIQKNHCKSHKLPWDEHKATRAARRMFELMWNFKFLPPGRGLWTIGTDHVVRHGSGSLNNCGFVSTDNIANEPSKPFCFIMDMSMVGVGVGFDTRGAGQLEIRGPATPADEPYIFTIPDSREGWVESLRLLIDAYAFGLPEPEFDYSKIRLEGEPIKGFGGLASGPGPLKDMHEDIRAILKGSVGRTLDSEGIVDIGNIIGRCVVAGNVRRSAEIVFGDPADEVFLKLKQDKEKLNTYRWASNNSVFAEVGMDYSEVAKHTAINGEPGYLYLENARAFGRMMDPPTWIDSGVAGANPCVEQSLWAFELCTLVESFPGRHATFEEYAETLKIAYLYAKTITLVQTEWEETNAVMMKNRRIGLSQSGIIKAFGRHGRREMFRWCDEGYKFIDSLDVIYSNWLGVPRSIKKTSVKPSGTVSLLPGEPPGIHYPHSEYYIRRVRVAKASPLAAAAKDAGYNVEPVIGQEETTVVVEFPVHEEYMSRSKDDVSIWEQVANAAAYQKYWADNQVSITVTFSPDEAEDIPHVLEMFEDSLKGISFLPIEEHGYVQAPYETISAERYESLVANLSEISFDNDDGFGHNMEAPKFCDGDVCDVPEQLLKKES